MDDAKARKYAILLNVEVIGTLGLLKMAKKRGIIPSVKKTIAICLRKATTLKTNL